MNNNKGTCRSGGTERPSVRVKKQWIAYDAKEAYIYCKQVNTGCKKKFNILTKYTYLVQNNDKTQAKRKIKGSLFKRNIK